MRQILSDRARIAANPVFAQFLQTYRLDSREGRILLTLAEALLRIPDSASRNDLITSLLPQAELTFKAALTGYETGKVDFATLLDAQRQIRQAKLNQIKSRAEAQVRLAEIERILGEEL